MRNDRQSIRNRDIRGIDAIGDIGCIESIRQIRHAGASASTECLAAARWQAMPALVAATWAFCAMAATSVLPAYAVAATPWRCGNTYSDTPCPGGRRIDVDAAPGDAARRAADEATSRIEHRADAMERDRLRTEQTTAARNGAVILPDHRVAEAQAREASRRTAERISREDERRRNRTSNQGAGRRHAAAGNVGTHTATAKRH